MLLLCFEIEKKEERLFCALPWCVTVMILTKKHKNCHLPSSITFTRSHGYRSTSCLQVYQTDHKFTKQTTYFFLSWIKTCLLHLRRKGAQSTLETRSKAWTLISPVFVGFKHQPKPKKAMLDRETATASLRPRLTRTGKGRETTLSLLQLMAAWAGKGDRSARASSRSPPG